MDKTDIDSLRTEGLSAEALLREKEILSQQVKRLIKAESKLYEFQEQLDAQLREYKNLYDLSRKLNSSRDIRKLCRYTVTYVVECLEFERAILLIAAEDSKSFEVCSLEGYYEKEERCRVAQLVLGADTPFLAPLVAGEEYIICTAACGDPELALWRDRLGMNEYLLYPLGHRSVPHALLAVGNSVKKAEFYRRVGEGQDTLLSMGNLTALVSSSIENYIFYTKMTEALEQERIAQAKYRGIFENAVEGIFVCTASGRFIAANPSLARMLGCQTPEELMNAIQRGQLFVDAPRLREFRRYLQEFGTVERFETQLHRIDGRVIWVSANARVVRDSAGELLYEGTAEDITERKEAEQALRESERRYRQLSEALEQRVQETVDELRHKDKMLIIQGRQAVMGEMIGNIAHQWRQPLNMLGLLAQDLLITKQLGEVSEEYLTGSAKRTMEIIQGMSRTIDDLRFFFRPEQEKSEFRVLEVIEKTLGLLEGSFAAHGIRTAVEKQNDPVISGYPGEFSQVLINILINARDVLVEREVHEPTVLVTLLAQGERTVVTVRDNAGGVPEEIMDKIFEPYFSTKGPTGTGIGLFMCKTIIEKNMNGNLSVRNVADGAEFRIEV